MAGERIGKFLKSKTARTVLVCIGALLLLLAVWLVFFSSDSKDVAANSTYQPTEREARLCKLLSDVEGIENATAMITEENGLPVSAIVVFEGADSILSRIRVLDITAAALNIDKKFVQVYPAGK